MFNIIFPAISTLVVVKAVEVIESKWANKKPEVICLGTYFSRSVFSLIVFP